MLEHLSRRVFSLWLVIWMLATGASAEGSTADPAAEAVPTLFPGRQAPAIEVEEFLQGSPLKSFQPGHVYVVEFWATWCGPCVAQFPHLSEIQRKHADKLTVIGVNVWEDKEYSPNTKAHVRDFIVKQADRMSYTVAYDGAAAKMSTSYMKAAGQNGIPTSFIVDGNGVVAWLGHPATMERPLREILAGEFKIEKAKQSFDENIAYRREVRRQRAAAEPLLARWTALWDQGKQEDALPLMTEMIQLSPLVGYDAVYRAMSYLLGEKKDPARARKFALTLIETAYKDSSSGLGALADAIINRGNGDQPAMLDIAFRAAERANELDGGKYYSTLDALATICFLKGEPDRAIDFQSKAVEAAGDDPEVRADLTRTLEKYKHAVESKDGSGSKDVNSPSK